MADRTFDLRLGLSESGADFVLELGDLARDEGLATGVVLSLFCDQRAQVDDDLPDGSDEPRGWWADERDDPSGSRLWLLTRSKVTPTTAVQLRRAAEQALAWLVTDGIAERVTVAATVQAAGFEERIDLAIELGRGSATRWASLWDSIGEDTYPAPGVRLQLLPA